MLAVNHKLDKKNKIFKIFLSTSIKSEFCFTGHETLLICRLLPRLKDSQWVVVYKGTSWAICKEKCGLFVQQKKKLETSLKQPTIVSRVRTE